ncbi:hypothetical protein [Rhizobium sp. L43]|uniref:hypothetical protein n=1 Tax=Rhizobium sp. L43 TaxID=2035452 RepID=UPI00117A4154|nr:hypothetical protein [Rhizobium sp. L43]
MTGKVGGLVLARTPENRIRFSKGIMRKLKLLERLSARHLTHGVLSMSHRLHAMSVHRTD